MKFPNFFTCLRVVGGLLVVANLPASIAAPQPTPAAPTAAQVRAMQFRAAQVRAQQLRAAQVRAAQAQAAQAQARPAQMSNAPAPSTQTRVLPSAPSAYNAAPAPAMRAQTAPAPVAARKDQEIDLNQMSVLPPVAPSPAAGGANGTSPSNAATRGAPPRIDLSNVILHFYFDFWLINRPGFGPLTFQNIHSISMLEAQPREDLFFSAEISTNPRFYEIKYAPVGKKWNIRVGKIWIPFDDINPHNHFGGRTNTRQLLTGNTLFLPNIWTELGVAVESKLYEFRGWKAVGSAYVTNGFGAGGKNPSGDTGEYPNFADSDSLSTDNNSDKAIGARLQFNYKQSFEIGASVYTDRWSSQAQESKRMTLIGLDSGVQFGRFELRGGYFGGKVDLMDGSMKKGGAYAEFWTKFLPDRNLRVALKGGVLQYDDRYISVNDIRAIGAGIYYRPNFIQYSIEHSQDTQKVEGKKGYGITWARLAILI